MSSPDSAAIAAEITTRRTFAIISHPDAGKTTLTEKLLLYGGAIHLAGSVKARRAARHATSDWMALERERGISVTSSVMQFTWQGYQVNLLDTPGHADFSEDTYRTLVAADSAVMLLDNRRGVEARTRQLFEVCKMRRMPIFSFVNKCDRPGGDPLQLIGDVEADLGLQVHPVTWPITTGAGFVGVADRRRREVLLFDRTIDHGASLVETRRLPLDDGTLADTIGASALQQLRDELDLLEGAAHPFDEAAILDGTLSPMYFGSALTNFGVEPFLVDFLEHAPPPLPREAEGRTVEPTDPDFTGFVFKIQANMDPRHRDRIAFVRICSGHFESGLTVQLARGGKPIRIAQPQQFLAQERSEVEEAWPGDVIGVLDRGNLRVSDSLSLKGDVTFLGIPRFAPSMFSRVVLRDPLRRKHLDTGLRQLAEEGAVQVFYQESMAGPVPIVGAVGALQFDVLIHRLEHEYAVRATLEPMPFRVARWVRGPEEAIERLVEGRSRLRLYDAKGGSILLFEDEWALRHGIESGKELEFLEAAP
ncbi:MAG: peptide chain release factor 3 [Gemmatimonadales bacterium]|jgi:peptide chain release factor 3|nr:peptide chain release factor 3 [Gemmatimonadales bacterium]